MFYIISLLKLNYLIVIDKKIKMEYDDETNSKKKDNKNKNKNTKKGNKKDLKEDDTIDSKLTINPDNIKNNTEIKLDPSIIHFQHSKIKPVFSDHKAIDETIEEIRKDITVINKIPKIQVIVDKDGYCFTLNNRRLYVYKTLFKEGLIKTIEVRVRHMESKEYERYNVKNCSLNAKFMFPHKKENKDHNEEDITKSGEVKASKNKNKSKDIVEDDLEEELNEKLNIK